MQVLPSNDDSTGHLGGDNTASEDTSSNGDLPGERALLVNVSTVDGFGGGLVRIDRGK